MKVQERGEGGREQTFQRKLIFPHEGGFRLGLESRVVSFLFYPTHLVLVKPSLQPRTDRSLPLFRWFLT